MWLGQLICSGKGGESTCLNKPRPLPEAVQSELISNLCGIHGVGKILLVSEYEKQGVPKLILVQHPLQLLTSLSDTFPIVRVDNEDDTLGILEVWGCLNR